MFSGFTPHIFAIDVEMSSISELGEFCHEYENVASTATTI